MPIDVRPEDDGADGAHEKADSERHQRQHERREVAAGGKVRLRDVRRVIAVHDEVVHLEKVAAGNAHDVAHARR